MVRQIKCSLPCGAESIKINLYEYDLNENHVERRAYADGQQHIALPQVQRRDHGYGDKLRQAVGRGGNGSRRVCTVCPEGVASDRRESFIFPILIFYIANSCTAHTLKRMSA